MSLLQEMQSISTLSVSSPEVRVKVRLIEAEGLLIADKDSSDPYCELSLNGELFSSEIKKATLNPKWDEEFEFGTKKKFRLKPPISELTITCIDDDRFGSDALGCVIIPLSEFVFNGIVRRTRPFQI